MASSSKPSDEEMQKRYKAREESYIKRQGGIPESSVPGAAQVSYVQNADYNIGDVAPTIRTDKRGRKYIASPQGNGDMYFNERTGAYQGREGQQIMIRPGTPAQEEGGGGGQAPVVEAISEGYVDYGSPGNTYVAGGSEIVNRQPMDDWRPTARNSNGGGSYNPLVNPVNWMHNPDPLQVRNVGTYIQPNKKSYNGGLL